MGRYLDTLKKSEKSPSDEPNKPNKPHQVGFLGFLGTSSAHFEKHTAANDDDESRILDWLSRIGETDPVTIGEVIDRCRADPEARAYFLGRAAE